MPSGDGFLGEIHILSGSERLTMALWMAASWITATGGRWRFVFHDDGTLREQDASAIRRILPGCRVIMDAESREEVQAVLCDYPLSWRCRNLHPLCRKLFDIPHYAHGAHFLTIDTDILFFRKPDRLLQWMQSGKKNVLFLEDVADATLSSAASAAQHFGREIIRKVNTGIVAMPKTAVTFDDLEHCLAKTLLLEEDRWFVEQSLYAVLASLHGDVELLGNEYHMPISGEVPPTAVARHYMGKVRHLFYSEGLPRVVKALKNAGDHAA